jgi:hypothetical protein
MTRRLLLLLCAWIAAPLLAAAQNNATPPSAPPQTYALLIGGLGGQEPYNHWYEDWTDRFKKYLTGTAGLPDGNVTVLTKDAATADRIQKAIAKLAQQVKPQDQFILFLAGHGEITGKSPTLMLPGPDLSVDDLVAELAAISSKNQVILNFSASSGDFLKHLVSPTRVNIAATSPTEGNEPMFAEFFLRGMESKRANGGKPDPINLLEAYNWATQQTALWIVRWQQTGGTEAAADATNALWKANGKETVEIFEKLYPNVPTHKLDPSSDRNAPDAVMPLAPPNGEITDDWTDRRVVDEHATLEDCGQEIAVSAIGDKGYQPILGEKQNDPGYLAKMTVLGKPGKTTPPPAPALAPPAPAATATPAPAAAATPAASTPSAPSAAPAAAATPQ